MGFYHIQVIEKRLHVWGDFLLFVSRQKAQILVRKRYNGTCQQDLPVNFVLFESRSQCKKCFAGAGFSRETHQLDIGIVEHFESESLFGIAGKDAEIIVLVNLFDLFRKRIVACQHTIAIAFQNKALIGFDGHFKIEFVEIHTRRLRINFVDQVGINSFEGFFAFIKNIDVHYLVVDVIFGQQSQRTGFHAKIDIFRNQNGFHLRIFFRNIDHCRKNAVVGRVFGKGFRYAYVGFRTVYDIKFASTDAQIGAIGKERIIGDFVQFANESAGIIIDLVTSFFKLIQFFEYHKGDVNIVFFEIVQAFVVVENDIGVEDEIFFLMCRSGFCSATLRFRPWLSVCVVHIQIKLDVCLYFKRSRGKNVFSLRIYFAR